jgi:hypothetical protein
MRLKNTEIEKAEKLYVSKDADISNKLKNTILQSFLFYDSGVKAENNYNFGF